MMNMMFFPPFLFFLPNSGESDRVFTLTTTILVSFMESPKGVQTQILPYAVIVAVVVAVAVFGLEMDETQRTAGILYISIGTIFPLIYGRMVYILLSRKRYRDLECFRIVALIGIVQLFCAPGPFLCGLAHLLDYDPWSIASWGMKLFAFGCRTEPPLSFVLALNRIKILCDLKYPAMIHKVLIAIILLYGCAYFGALLTPFTDFIVTPRQHLGIYNFSLPLTVAITQTSAIVNIASMTACLICYVIVCFYLVCKKTQIGTIKDWKAEKGILIYAFLKFLLDVLIVIGYNYMPIPPYEWVPVFISFSYSADMLFLPPVLYIFLNKSIRSEFFACIRASN
ncbi:hypothetical protein L596_019194 [Steinernema carpocapsae]|uniref:Serpentine receptor class gamma n=1 Tax=Steinernema carpocapsae TaxID=34508 RepID=A0A4U5MPJ5_STECR|nr:hypothetical protein L596_019194 [Steinernema carpocapsae]